MNADDETLHKPAASRSWLRRVAPDILGVAVVLLLMLSARSTLADHYHVPSGSMLPTVEIGDRVFVSKAAYGLRLPFTSTQLVAAGEPERGDVVVLESPEDRVILLKRIAALPGDTVEVRGGRLYLDGEVVPVVEDGDGLDELLGEHRHPVRLSGGGGPDFGPSLLGADEYLVLGDNRGDSRDGRSFGLVHRDALRGRVVATYLRGGSLTWRKL